MKKIMVILSIVMCSFLMFMGCLSTDNSNMSAFSTSEKVKSGNMIISTDEFQDIEKAFHKDVGIDFTGGFSDVYFEPYFIYDDEYVSFMLKLQYNSIGDSNTVCKKIVLLGDSGRVTLTIKANTALESEPASALLGNFNKSIVSERISKEDYEKLTKFFASNQKIRMGFYSTDNKAEELKEYSTRAHTIFADAYSFYSVNLSTKTPVSENINPLIWDLK